MEPGKQESQELMNYVKRIAKQKLSDQGEFLPFGGVMKPNGELIRIGANKDGEHQQSSELIAKIQQSFSASAREGKYKATAIVYDVQVPVPETDTESDAIAIALDHMSGYSVIVFFPYLLQNGQLEIGKIFAQDGDHSIFLNDD